MEKRKKGVDLQRNDKFCVLHKSKGRKLARIPSDTLHRKTVDRRTELPLWQKKEVDISTSLMYNIKSEKIS
jgi:hypothetical protein